MHTIGVVGGTGKLGMALGGRWAKAGHKVIIGSRDADNAATAAKTLAEQSGGRVEGKTNLDAATLADIVVITVPFAAQAERMEEIRAAVQGKIVVDTTVPLMPPRVMRVQLPTAGSAALCAQKILGDGVKLVSAFHSVAAHKLATDAVIACDVLVFSDDKPAREVVVSLTDDAGLRGIQGGPLVNAVAAEALTSVLIFINKTYQVDGAGMQISGELVQPSSA